jgi:hypothetical protein
MAGAIRAKYNNKARSAPTRIGMKLVKFLFFCFLVLTALIYVVDRGHLPASMRDKNVVICAYDLRDGVTEAVSKIFKKLKSPIGSAAARRDMQQLIDDAKGHDAAGQGYTPQQRQGMDNLIRNEGDKHP